MTRAEITKANISTIQSWMTSDVIKKRFNEVLDKGAGAFVSSLLSMVKASPQLASCEPKTVMSAAMTAATLKLPINPNLGFAYIIPYKSTATFQIGYKGIIQLAMRSGQYKTINAAPVYEGQIEDVDFITGEIIRGKRTSDTVIGYIAYFKLVNGFEKTLYMTKEEITEHAKKFSQSFNRGTSVWNTMFDAMALKTVLKLLISKYGIMSIDMQGEAMSTALERDQAAIKQDGTPVYVDNGQTYDVAPEFEEEPDVPEEEVPQAHLNTSVAPTDEDEGPSF